MIPKNKKSNVPITLLVIMTFLACTVALISFVMAREKVVDIISLAFLAEKMNSQIEDFSVYHDLRRVDTNVNDQGELIFYQEYSEYFGSLFWEKEVKTLVMESPLS